MVILEAALLYILYKFFGAIFPSDQFVPRTAGEAQKKAELMRMAAEYLKGQEADKEKEKEEQKNLDDLLENKNLSEEEKKEVEGYVKEGNSEQLEKNANALEKASELVKDAKTNEKGEIIVDAKLNEKLKNEDEILPVVVKHEIAKQEKEKETEIKETKNLEDAPVEEKKEIDNTKVAPVEEKKEIEKPKEVSAEEKQEVENTEKIQTETKQDEIKENDIKENDIKENNVKENDVKENEIKENDKEEPELEESYILQRISNIDSEKIANLPKTDEPDRVKINEKILSIDIQKEDDRKLFEKYSEKIDNKQMETGLRRSEYLPFKGQYSDGVFVSGNKKDIEEYLTANRNTIDTYAKAHLEGRLKAIEVFDDLEKNKDTTQKGIMKPAKAKDENGTEMIMFDKLKCNEFQNGNECWSYSYSLLLKSRGVSLKPEYIRSFRPGLNKEDIKEMSENGDNVWTQLNTSSRNSIFEMADLTDKVLNNTGIHGVLLRGDDKFAKKDPEEKKKAYVDQIKSIVRDALGKDNSPVAMSFGSSSGTHVNTIVGIDGDNLIIQDSLSTRHGIENPSGIDPKRAGEYLKVNINDLALKIIDNKSKNSLGFEWLKDLQPDKKGNCKDIESITNGTLKCENGKFDYSGQLTSDEAQILKMGDPLIRVGKVGHWEEEKTEEKGGLTIEHRFYVPKEMKAPEKNLGEKNKEKDLNKNLKEPEKKEPERQVPQKNGPGMMK